MDTEYKAGLNPAHDKAIEWGRKKLLSLGFELSKAAPVKVLQTHWSLVVYFETNQGLVYLKHTPEQLAIEAPILECLADIYQAQVPKVIAYDRKYASFLMLDAGSSLRQALKSHFDIKTLCKGIKQFTALQLSIADNIKPLLEMGVPDWRLDQMPQLFALLLEDERLLLADGLNTQEISELKAKLPRLQSLCDQLAQFPIKPTIVQPDFSDNNMLINQDQVITHIDLGEIVISHPFFSLLNCLWVTKKHHALVDGGSDYQQILDCCLHNFKKNGSSETLSQAWRLAQQLWFIYDALSQYRLIEACGSEQIFAFQRGKLRGVLRAFAAHNDTI